MRNRRTTRWHRTSSRRPTRPFRPSRPTTHHRCVRSSATCCCRWPFTPGAPTLDSAGALLWSVVAALRSHDIDGEAALRARARIFRDRLATVERDAHAEQLDVRELDHAGWRERWDDAGDAG